MPRSPSVRASLALAVLHLGGTCQAQNRTEANVIPWIVRTQAVDGSWASIVAERPRSATAFAMLSLSNPSSEKTTGRRRASLDAAIQRANRWLHASLESTGTQRGTLVDRAFATFAVIESRRLLGFSLPSDAVHAFERLWREVRRGPVLPETIAWCQLACETGDRTIRARSQRDPSSIRAPQVRQWKSITKQFRSALEDGVPTLEVPGPRTDAADIVRFALTPRACVGPIDRAVMNPIEADDTALLLLVVAARDYLRDADDACQSQWLAYEHWWRERLRRRLSEDERGPDTIEKNFLLSAIRDATERTPRYWEHSLHAAIRSADRVRYLSHATLSIPVFEESDGDEVRDLVDNFQVDGRASGGSCLCRPSAVLQFYYRDHRIAEFRVHHGSHLRWERWPGQGTLTQESASFLKNWIDARTP